MTRVRITHPDVVHDVGDEVEVSDERAERLVNIGYADYVDAPAPAEPQDEPAGQDDAPAKSATKAEWVEHAVAQGWSREDAEAATKVELIDATGGGD